MWRIARWVDGLAAPDLEMIAQEDLVARCPALASYNAVEQEQVTNPYPMWALSQREAPVQYIAALGMWFVTSYDLVAEVIRDTATYSSSAAITLPPVPAELKHRLPKGWPAFAAPTLVNGDPPDHTPIRKLAQKALSPRMVAARESALRRIATGLLDGLYDRGECDLLTDFAKPFTSAAVGDVLGINDPDARARFGQWADDSFYIANPSLPAAEMVERGGRLAEAREFIESMIEERRARPQDDLISALVHAQASGASLSTVQIVSIVIQLVVAGVDSTAGLIANTVFLSLTSLPDEWDRMQRDPETIPKVLEEMLRFRGPVRGNMRATTREVELGGVRIPADATIFVCVAAASSDESQFPDAQTFDCERPNLSRHFAFGRGTHFCLGAPLARLEARIALEEILQRLPELRLRQGADVQWLPILIPQGLSGVPVDWTP